MKFLNTPEDVIANLEKYKNKINVIVGISSFNNSKTISNVVEKSAIGMKDYFDSKGLIINSDGGSSDGTRDRFTQTDTFDVPKVGFEYRGIPGKGSAMRSIMEIAHFLNAKVVVFLDADLKSVEPWWLERLAKPILNGKADYVAPYYTRHKYDGTITNQVCFPMTSILYGKKVRQPIGGDFGVGLKMIKLFLEKPEDVWNKDVAKFGIDIWMTTNSIAHGGRVLQSALGAKVHDVKDPAKHLGPMFEQVVGTLFELMIEFKDVWFNVERVEEVEIYGEIPKTTLEEVKVDVENMRRKASEMVRSEMANLSYLPRNLVDSVIESGKLELEGWVRILFDSSVEYKRRRDKSVVRNLIPFYFARVADFVEKTERISNDEAEKIIQDQLEEFLKMKDYLKKRWSG